MKFMDVLMLIPFDIIEKKKRTRVVILYFYNIIKCHKFVLSII